MNNNINVDFKDVAKLLRMLRESEHLSQDEVAKALGVSKTAISLWESGECGIKTASLYDLADFYNVSVSELILGKLNGETDVEFFKRNYDLNDKPDFAHLDKSDMDEAYAYLDKCLVVKKTYFDNYFDWIQNKISSFTADKMDYISKYFRFCDHMGHSCSVHSLTGLYDDLENDPNIGDYNYLMFRLSKAFSFKPVEQFKRKIEIVSQYHDAKLMDKVLALYSQYDKDLLLNKTICNSIKDDGFLVECLVRNGARCFFDVNNYETKDYSEICDCKGIHIDEELDKKIETLEKMHISFNDADDEQSIRTISIVSRIDYYSYLSLIDYDKTIYLQNMIKYKSTDSLKFYELCLTM